MCLISDLIALYIVHETSGQFVTYIGRYGHGEGQFHNPSSITSCTNGFIYILSDWQNNRVQILCIGHSMLWVFAEFLHCCNW